MNPHPALRVRLSPRERIEVRVINSVRFSERVWCHQLALLESK
jgi:hypothetical protein